MLQQGGSATGLEGTAELYSLEGSGETPFLSPRDSLEERIKQLGIEKKEKWPPF